MYGQLSPLREGTRVQLEGCVEVATDGGNPVARFPFKLAHPCLLIPNQKVHRILHNG